MPRAMWSEPAIADVERIVSFIGERNPSAARRMRNLIVEAAERLSAQPFLYRQGQVAGTRELIVHPSYILVYRVEVDVVHILSVLHTSQQYPPA